MHNVNFKEMTGQIFTRLTVLKLACIGKKGTAYWLCKCKCGREKIVGGANLRRKASKSCGCLQREKATTHGLTNTKWYKRQSYWKLVKIKNLDGTQFSVKDFQLAFERQDGKCYICNVSEKNLSRVLDVDHDHKTGFFRGLLCANCNTALGNSRENIKILESMISYLKTHERTKLPL